MPRMCRFPGRTPKPGLYQVVLIHLGALTSRSPLSASEHDQLKLCIKFLIDSSFTEQERAHIGLHLKKLIASRAEASILQPLLEHFPDTPVTS